MSTSSPTHPKSTKTKHLHDDNDHHRDNCDHRSRRRQHPTRPCRFFRSRGGCRAGEACRFAHVGGGAAGGFEKEKIHPVPPAPKRGDIRPKGGKTSDHRPAGTGTGARTGSSTGNPRGAVSTVTTSSQAAKPATPPTTTIHEVGEGVTPAASPRSGQDPHRDHHRQQLQQQEQRQHQQQQRWKKKSNQRQRAAQAQPSASSPSSQAHCAASASSTTMAVTCRYGPDCTVPNCGLRHSPDSSSAAPGQCHGQGHGQNQGQMRGSGGVGNDGKREGYPSTPKPTSAREVDGGDGDGDVPAQDLPRPSPARNRAHLSGGGGVQRHQQRPGRGQRRGAGRDSSAVIPCRFFSSPGGRCARGDKCKFAHVVVSESDREDSERRRAGSGDGSYLDGDAASAEAFDPAPKGRSDAARPPAHVGDADGDCNVAAGPEDDGIGAAIVNERDERPECARGGDVDDDASLTSKGKPGQRRHRYDRDCNFGERCRRRNCKYVHPNGRAIDRNQQQQHQRTKPRKEQRAGGGESSNDGIDIVDTGTAEAPLQPPQKVKIETRSKKTHHSHNVDGDDLHIIHNNQSGKENSAGADGGANDDTLAPIDRGGAKAHHRKQPHRSYSDQERADGGGRGTRAKDASFSNRKEHDGKINQESDGNNKGMRADGANYGGQAADDAADRTRRDKSLRAESLAAVSSAAASPNRTTAKGSKTAAIASSIATGTDGTTTPRENPSQPNVALDTKVLKEQGSGVEVGVTAPDERGDGNRGGGKENVSHPDHRHPDRRMGKKKRHCGAGVVDVDDLCIGEEEEKKEMHPRDDHIGSCGSGIIVPTSVDQASGDAAVTMSKPRSMLSVDNAPTREKLRTPTGHQEEEQWACARCTLINPASSTRCEICQYDPLSGSDAATTAGGWVAAGPDEPMSKAGPNEWACRQCTLLNPKEQSRCNACERPRSPSTSDPDPTANNDVAGRDAKPRAAISSDEKRPNGESLTADVEGKAKTGKSTVAKRAARGVGTHPIVQDDAKTREEVLESAVRHLATLAQSSILASAFERWTAYARERRGEEERANIREKMRRERENAQKRREEKKNKKRERWIREQEQQERVRMQFWEKEMAHEEEHVSLLIELSVAEFVRQADDSETQVTADTVKSDLSARSKLLYCCRRVYRQLFGDRGNRNVTVVDIQNKALHGRTGTIQYYDDDKGKFCVGLDTKKAKKAELCFIKPGNLEVTARSKAAEQRKPSNAKAEYHLEVPALYLGFDLIMSVSKSDVEGMKANVLDLTSYLDQLMKCRDKEDKARREAAKKAQKLEEQRKKDDAKRRARMNEEWEEEKQRRDRDKAAREEMKRERRRQQRAGHSSPFQRRGPEAFFGGGMGGPTFVFSNGRGFVFFGGYDDFFDDGDDYFDHEGGFYEDEDSEEEREAARKEHAEVLGVAENASAQEIRSAYRKQALIYHPDKFKADAAGGMTKKAAEEHFKKMNNAYESLLGGFDT